MGETVLDKTADEMLQEIKRFANSDGHDSLSALVILSHGDNEGAIGGNDVRRENGILYVGSRCSVQEVVDMFCDPVSLKSVTKVLKRQ